MAIATGRGKAGRSVYWPSEDGFCTGETTIVNFYTPGHRIRLRPVEGTGCVVACSCGFTELWERRQDAEDAGGFHLAARMPMRAS